MTGPAVWISSGVLFGFSFPPFPFPYLAWFAFVPLLLSWRSRTEARRAYLDAYFAFLVTFGIAFQWPVFHEITATALLSVPPLLVLPMWMALPFGLAHAASRRFGTRVGICAWIVLTILAEYALRAGPLAFPWALIGHSQAAVFPINGLAAFGGVALLSLVVLFANCALFFAARRSAGHAAVLGALVLLLTSGINLSYPPSTASEADGSHFRMAGIQPALSPLDWADLNDDSRVDLLLALSRRAATADTSIDLIVWPETAIPPHPATPGYIERLQSFVDSAGIPILAGAITTGGGRADYRNSAVLSSPRSPVRTYDKVNLVPFAERVPFAQIIPFLERFAIPAGGVSGYEPGENRKIFEIPGLRFGVLICFETLFGDAARAYARDGAEAIVAITQDGWWGDSFGYRQHLAFNRLRSIETNLPVVQVAVSGISAVIHPNGRIEQTAGWMQRAVWTAGVPLPGPNTLYVRIGDWVTALAGIIAIAGLVIYGVRSGVANRTRRGDHAL